MKEESETEKRGVERFVRTANQGSTAWIFFRTLFYAAIIWGLTLFLIPVLIVCVERWIDMPEFSFAGQLIVAVILFCVATSISMPAAFTMARIGRGTPLPMDCAPKLVVSGPYRYLRNPMAVGGLLQGFAVGLGWGSWSVLCYVLVGMVVWNYYVRPLEEADLKQRFGDSYIGYCQQVRCWLPSLGYDPRQESFEPTSNHDQ